jgi:hypothetical protein
MATEKVPTKMLKKKGEKKAENMCRRGGNKDA